MSKKKATREIPVLRTSERNDFKRCPFLWDMTWVKGFTTRRQPSWAWFGTAIHAALEVRYKPGVKRGTLKQMLQAFDDSMDQELGVIYTAGGEVDDDEVIDAKELGHAMLRGYDEYYGSESEWEVIHPEQAFQIDVMDPKDDSKLLAIYTGQWDLFARNRITKELWLWDHKTRKTFLSDWSYLELNDQSGSYLWVAPEVLRHMGLLKKNQQIEGIVFNYLRKHLPDTRPLDEDGKARNAPKKEHFYAALKNTHDLNPARLPSIAVLSEMADDLGLTVLGDISARQPAPLFHREEVYRTQAERATMGKRVQAEVASMNAMRRGKLPIYKTPAEDCVRCKIFEYCLMHEKDPVEAETLAKAILMKRDPYEAHREELDRAVVIKNG